MEVEMNASPSRFHSGGLGTREQFRRYGKRHSASSISLLQDSSILNLNKSRLLCNRKSIHSPSNSLFLQKIKQEDDGFDGYHEGDYPRMKSASKKKSSVIGSEAFDVDLVDSQLQHGSHSLNFSKNEDDSLIDSAKITFTLFASLLDSSIQEVMPIPNLILEFESLCRKISESIRYHSDIMHQVEDRLMRQKALLLLDEAATWSLLWHLYGKLTEELPEDYIMLPSTSHVESCQFVANDHTAQLCLRIIQWLEGLASEALDLESKIHGSYVGTYLPSSGIWCHTQRMLQKGVLNANTIHHLDFDAPTRDHAHQLVDDQKQDESILEDVWTLIRAGRLEEACDLCHSAGQPWRAAAICPFGGVDLVPSVEALLKNGKNRTLQAIELESGIGHQWRLWKWASFCASEVIAEQNGSKYEAALFAIQCSNLKCILPVCTNWESACWAIAKSWLDVQIDLEMGRQSPGRMEKLKNHIDCMDGSPIQDDISSNVSAGSEDWPIQVLNQQPQNLSGLFQKLHSGEGVNESVTRSCKDPQRQIEMNLMSGNIPFLLDLIWSWIAPSEDDQNVFRPNGDPEMIRFGAHLVLVLRNLVLEEMKDSFKEKLMNIGDLIVHVYVMFLFSNQHEELVGMYASQLARHRCVDLFVHMMERRLNSSAHIKNKLFISALEYLPFSSSNECQGCFEEIIERVLSRSREIISGDYEPCEVVEKHQFHSLQKAMVIQWLCFTPPPTVLNAEDVSIHLLFHALVHSNILFREFAMFSLWREPSMPIGAHSLFGFLAEPLKKLSEIPDTLEDYVSKNLNEFEDWNLYYSCDAKYRNWLKFELENIDVPPLDLSLEEKERTLMAAEEMLDSSFSLLFRKENPWMASHGDCTQELVSPLFIELHAIVMLCLPSGECMSPDATICSALISSLYSSVTEEDLHSRQLKVNVVISPRNSYYIEIVLRCLAAEGDGLGTPHVSDGGILGTIVAAGFKGELDQFQPGVTMEISRLDAWYSGAECYLESPATYIILGLCRRCCIPEIILRCMQVSVFLLEMGHPSERHDELIELVAAQETAIFSLFSQHQLEEFLLFEREYSICKMEFDFEEATLRRVHVSQ